MQNSSMKFCFKNILLVFIISGLCFPQNGLSQNQCVDNHRTYETVAAEFAVADKGPVLKRCFDTFNIIMSLRHTGGHFSGSKGALQKSIAVLQDYLVPIVKEVAPISEWWIPGGKIPTYDNVGRGPTHNIFLKLFRDASYRPTPEEIKVLEQYRSLEWYLKVQSFYLRHPLVVKAKQSLYGLAAVAKWAIVVAVLTTMQAQGQENGTVDLQSFLNTPIGVGQNIGGRGAVYQAQLISETVPFPHMAIRLGDTVYSYGQTHLTATSVDEYLNSKRMAQAVTTAIEQGHIVPPSPEVVAEDVKKGSFKQTSAYVSDLAWRAAARTGIADLPRSVQVATLNLSQQEYQNLRNEIINHVGKKYANTTFVNDCATMVARAISKHTKIDFTRLIDASPGQMIMYLASLKVLGSRYVDSVKLVLIEDIDSPGTHITRNAVINYAEGVLFLKMFLINQGHRLGVDLWHDQESIQFLEDQMKEGQEDFIQTILEAVKNQDNIQNVIDQVKYFEERGSNLDRNRREEVRSGLLNTVNFEFSREIQSVEQMEASPISDSLDRLIIPHKKIYLIETRASLTKRINAVHR